MTRYKVNKGHITEYIDETLVIFDGENSVLFSLNETATFIFNQIKSGKSSKRIIKALTERYDIDETKARNDLNRLLKQMETEDIILD